jgi:hypothetical protein
MKAGTRMPATPPEGILNSFTQMQTNIIIASRTNNPFARVPKSMLDDPELSWQAKGILAYLLGKPPNWKLRVKDLSNHARNGETSIRSALKELRGCGYAELIAVRNKRGRVIEWIWRIGDSPVFSGTHPDRGFPHLENRHSNENEPTKNKSKARLKPSPTPGKAGSGCEGEEASEDIPATWKPTSRTKQQQLRRIAPPDDYPSEDDFQDFLEQAGMDNIMEYRPEFYETICRDKWHQWKERRWKKIYDWQAYVIALNETIGQARGQR